MTDAALSQTCYSTAPLLHLWPGRAVYHGPSMELGMHSGSVSCLAVGLDDGFTLETDADGGSYTGRSALIRPRVRHRIRAHGSAMAFGYFEPGSAAERACADALGAGNGRPVAVSAAREGALLGLVGQPGPELEAIDAAQADPRIRAATHRLLLEPQVPRGADDFAFDAGLSRSRFLHVFREQTGITFRRYRLWARMLRAGRSLRDFGSLTRAAADAGFSNPSHLSSTFHATFGLRPSDLLSTGVVIVDHSGPHSRRRVEGDRQGSDPLTETAPWRKEGRPISVSGSAPWGLHAG
ncbi:AraC family transcriptional regulator [Streptomyces sp. NPDC004647]|uniref:helix-turn-helix domain-containing protein n=1 Tax=Streptomyces sp. NPDC004647 TaxID=3154671 RepID=UPI0033B88F69